MHGVDDNGGGEHDVAGESSVVNEAVVVCW